MELTPKIGVITGNFDVIHLGYVRLFKQLDNSCNYPIILLHGDPTIERPKKLQGEQQIGHPKGQNLAPVPNFQRQARISHGSIL